MPRAQNVLKRVVNSHCGGGGHWGWEGNGEWNTLKLVHFPLQICSSLKKKAIAQSQDSFCSLLSKKKKEKKSHIFKGITKAEYSSSVPQIFTKARVRQVTFWGHQHHLRRHSLRGHSLRLIWWVLSVPFPFCSLLLTPPHPPNHGCLHWKINWH